MEPIVATTTGKVRGRTTNGVNAFTGIPYAAAPVGPARFELPRPPATWDGVRDALQPGASCLQSPYPAPIEALLGRNLVPGEEYLNLNVWTPDPSDSGLPVMVWIHGGAYTRGCNAIPIYDGSAFARDGVVLVSINYRLGISGFAALDGAPLNRGLRDQLFALAWVQDNIAAFGGDPGNVTIFGESAGAMSVANLLASPAGTGLFHRAAMQSGTATAVAEPADARKVAGELARELGVPATASEFAGVEPRALQLAQDALALQLQQDPDPARWGESTIRAGRGVMSLLPVLDEELLPQVPTAAMAGGAARDVPLLAGANAEEFRFFTVPTGIAAAITPEALPFVLARHGIGEAAVQTYTANRPGASAGDVLSAILSDLTFRGDTVALADARAGAGASTYLYEFAWPSPVQNIGAAHAVELPFVFDNLTAGSSLIGTEPPQGLADEVHAVWVGFATHGDPGWPRFERDKRAVMTFGDQSAVVLEPRADELAALRAG